MGMMTSKYMLTHKNHANIFGSGKIDIGISCGKSYSFAFLTTKIAAFQVQRACFFSVGTMIRKGPRPRAKAARPCCPL